MGNRQARNENDVKKKKKGKKSVREHMEEQTLYIYLSTLKPYNLSVSCNTESHSSCKHAKEGKYSQWQPISKTH